MTEREIGFLLLGLFSGVIVTILVWLFTINFKYDSDTELLDWLKEQSEDLWKSIPAAPLDSTAALLLKNGYHITAERKIAYGKQYILSSGSIVNLFDSGKINVQGKPDAQLKKLMGLK